MIFAAFTFMGGLRLALHNWLYLDLGYGAFDQIEACLAGRLIRFLPNFDGSEEVRFDWSSVGSPIEATAVERGDHALGERSLVAEFGAEHFEMFGAAGAALGVFGHMGSAFKQLGLEEGRIAYLLPGPSGFAASSGGWLALALVTSPGRCA